LQRASFLFDDKKTNNKTQNTMKQKKYMLPESEIPTHYFNIQAIMPNKPLPFLHPATKQPLKPEDLYPIFCKACADQELNQTDEWIPIPEEVREQYAAYRCTPLVRAYELEKALGTPAHIYFKNSPCPRPAATS
jgi:Predicted alternative tryptophan synthase beta-subunit (paralog of TrpB)